MRQRPYILVNMTVTADVEVDTVERRGARISGQGDAARVDRMHAEVDTVMVGGKTLLREDVSLTVHDVALAGQRKRVDLPAALAPLAEDGIERLIGQGGSTLVAALFEARLVDELLLAVAPLLFGGQSAPTPVGGPGLTEADAIRHSLASVAPGSDGDVVLRYLVDGSAVR